MEPNKHSAKPRVASYAAALRAALRDAQTPVPAPRSASITNPEPAAEAIAVPTIAKPEPDAKATAVPIAVTTIATPAVPPVPKPLVKSFAEAASKSGPKLELKPEPKSVPKSVVPQTPLRPPTQEPPEKVSQADAPCSGQKQAKANFSYAEALSGKKATSSTSNIKPSRISATQISGITVVKAEAKGQLDQVPPKKSKKKKVSSRPKDIKTTASVPNVRPPPAIPNIESFSAKKGKKADSQALCSSNSGTTSLPIDDAIDARIREVIAEVEVREEVRDWNFQQREKRTRAMIEAHDRGDEKVSLWESQYEWDVKITCKDASWNVHHDILSRESEWFKDRLPPKDREAGYVQFDLPLHSKDQLGHVLKFMYDKKYDGAKLDTKTEPLDGQPILKNVLMYICGASVNCRSMMDFATDAIEDITQTILSGGPQGGHILSSHYCGTHDIFKFTDPFSLALSTLYEQGPNPFMVGMRVAMARLVDVCLMHLIINQSFRKSFLLQWMPALWQNVRNDSSYFAKHGLLDDIRGDDGQKSGDDGTESVMSISSSAGLSSFAHHREEPEAKKWPWQQEDTSAASTRASVLLSSAAEINSRAKRKRPTVSQSPLSGAAAAFNYQGTMTQKNEAASHGGFLAANTTPARATAAAAARPVYSSQDVRSLLPQDAESSSTNIATRYSDTLAAAAAAEGLW
ncbi:hypothetical protein B0H66DRAFT_634910 [Apodospora peruviana]|uniref:BTB domain-containing protein n=1 Tax=Apodospora peruviana TaxID=516989 RepID=A0AAE0MES4_9PEZI|nr:hypothetical protein B0H66DRAFT_634910 [Apodospora peruviana]